MMQAFGPYAQKEIIDFTKLGNRTMFVISGKTGAGKTTIFDGISYAIYGRASGNDRDGSGLRSQFAQDELMTEVALTFSLRNKEYYIWRSPQQEKKKARGDGYTTIGAKAELYFVENGERHLLAANVRDTDEKIKEIIQLDANQFRQILMIPQGEFKKLLTSDSKEKEVILQRLFRTEQFKQMEERLREEAMILKRSVESHTDYRLQLLRGASYQENEELAAALDTDMPNDRKIVALLEDEIKQLSQQILLLKKEVVIKQQERDLAKQHVDQAAEVLKQIAEKEALEKEKDNLLSQKEAINRKKAEISAAQKAARLGQQETICHRLKDRLTQVEKEWENAQQRMEKVHKSLQKTKERYENELSKEEERSKLREEIVKLGALKEDVDALALCQQETVLLQKQKETLEAEIANSKGKLRYKEQAIMELKKQQSVLEKMQLESFENEKKLDQMIKKTALLTKLTSSLKKCEQTRNNLQSHSETYEQKRKQYEHQLQALALLESQWRNGQAGMLAQSLVDGEGCPVCGAVHHPFPAQINDDMPTEASLNEAKTTLEKLEKEKAQAERNWITIETQYQHEKTALEEQIVEMTNLIPNFKVHETKERLQHLEKEQQMTAALLKEQKTAILALDTLGEQVKYEEEQLLLQKNSLEKQLEEGLKFHHAYTEKRIALDRLLKAIPEKIRSKEQYLQLFQNKQALYKQLEAALEAAQQAYQHEKEQFSASQEAEKQLRLQVEQARTALDKEREAFIVLMKEEGFAAYRDYKEAKRPQAVITEMEEQVQRYGELLRSVIDRFQAISDKLKGVKSPDLQALRTVLTETEAALAHLTEQQMKMSGYLERNEEIIALVKKINEELQEAEEKYHLIGHLADIARGQNTSKLTFERFVLAAFLDDILRAANTRLTKMTNGRYQLLRKMERSKGNIQSGLELLVFDQYTGQERHVKTLSGGESFKAALALALGLADVVQQYAGGVSLETMFIDEGFGTLDPESLDNAIETLMDIQSNGRLVGIISHVPELKERIDARLEVTSSKQGSRTAFHFMG